MRRMKRVIERVRRRQIVRKSDEIEHFDDDDVSL